MIFPDAGARDVAEGLLTHLAERYWQPLRPHV